MNTLQRTLKVCMRLRGMSTVDLAKALGMSKAGVNFLLNGQREFGLQSLRGIARAFPELDQEILDYLRDGHDEI